MRMPGRVGSLPLPIFLRPEAWWFRAGVRRTRGAYAQFCHSIQPILNPSAEILGNFIDSSEIFRKPYRQNRMRNLCRAVKLDGL